MNQKVNKLKNIWYVITSVEACILLYKVVRFFCLKLMITTKPKEFSIGSRMVSGYLILDLSLEMVLA